MKRLNLGCGRDIRLRYVNLDNLKLKGVDIIWDLNKLPITKFKENEFDEILAYNILEHFSNIKPIMNELYRISKKDTIIKIRVPYYNSENAFHDPTHKSFFSYDSFDYFSKDFKGYHYEGIKANFKVMKIDIVGFRLLPKSILRKISKYVPSLVTELRFTLKTIK